MQKRNYYRAGWVRFQEDADMVLAMTELSERKVSFSYLVRVVLSKLMFMVDRRFQVTCHAQHAAVFESCPICTRNR